MNYKINSLLTFMCIINKIYNIRDSNIKHIFLHIRKTYLIKTLHYVDNFH